MKKGYVYILANKTNSTIYVGVTSNLIQRIYQHKNDFVEGFTKKYHVHKLVYYEILDSIEVAIIREKEIKGKKRIYKNELINSKNPDWRDLYEDIIN